MNIQPIDFDYFKTAYFIYTTLAVIVACFIAVFVQKENNEEEN